jgi:cobalt-zinc-cadmium efflux system membrane fusion protein
VISSSTPILSTMNGVVVERNLALGQVVQPADALFVVADLGKLWATALVPEQQVRFVKQGQTVALEIPALGGAKRESKLVYVGQVVDPKTRTVVLRTELDNRDGQQAANAGHHAGDRRAGKPPRGAQCRHRA